MNEEGVHIIREDFYNKVDSSNVNQKCICVGYCRKADSNGPYRKPPPCRCRYPLHWAIECGSIDMMVFCIQLGALAWHDSMDWDNVLFAALHNDKSSEVKILALEHAILHNISKRVLSESLKILSGPDCESFGMLLLKAGGRTQRTEFSSWTIYQTRRRNSSRAAMALYGVLKKRTSLCKNMIQLTCKEVVRTHEDDLWSGGCDECRHKRHKGDAMDYMSHVLQTHVEMKPGFY